MIFFELLKNIGISNTSSLPASQPSYTKSHNLEVSNIFNRPRNLPCYTTSALNDMEVVPSKNANFLSLNLFKKRIGALNISPFWSRPTFPFRLLNLQLKKSLNSVPLFVLVNGSNQVLKFSASELPREDLFFQTKLDTSSGSCGQTFSFLFTSKKDAELHLQNITRSNRRILIRSQLHGLKISTITLDTALNLVQPLKTSLHRYFFFPNFRDTDSLLQLNRDNLNEGLLNLGPSLRFQHDFSNFQHCLDLPVYLMREKSFSSIKGNLSPFSKVPSHIVFFNIEDTILSWKKYRSENRQFNLSERPSIEVVSLSKLLGDSDVNCKDILFIPSFDYYTDITSHIKMEKNINSKYKTFFQNYIQPKILRLRYFNSSDTNRTINVERDLVNRKDFLWDKSFPTKKDWSNFVS